MSDRARPQISITDENGGLTAAADIDVTDPHVARTSLRTESGHLPVGTRERLVDAVLDDPEVSSRQHVEMTLPVGDTEMLSRVRDRCGTSEARVAGSSCLVEGHLHGPETTSAG